jgi:hypothetical protein
MCPARRHSVAARTPGPGLAAPGEAVRDNAAAAADEGAASLAAAVQHMGESLAQLLARSRAARATAAQEAAPCGAARRRVGGGAQPPVFERGAQYSQGRELAAARERRRAGSEGAGTALRRVLEQWARLDEEFVAANGKRADHMRKDHKGEWDEWLRRRNPPLYKEIAMLHARRMELWKWFCLLDTDGSLEISVGELVDPLLTVGLCRTRSEVAALVASVDDDGSGEIGFEEFLTIIWGANSDRGASTDKKDAAAAGCAQADVSGSGSASKRKGGDNAIVQLYKIASDGKLGDSDYISFSTLLATYRRKVCMSALAPLPTEENSAERRNSVKCVDALQRLYIEEQHAKRRLLYG